MRTKKFKSQRGWLDYLAKHGTHGDRQIYLPASIFFAEESRHNYFTDYGGPNERYHAERVSVPWEWKYEFATAVVNFHWPRRTKQEREYIARQLAMGKGELSVLEDFQLELRKTNGIWAYDYCTCGLSGPNYDWCKRTYIHSINITLH